jgi:hypothetical protein
MRPAAAGDDGDLAWVVMRVLVEKGLFFELPRNVIGEF